MSGGLLLENESKIADCVASTLCWCQLPIRRVVIFILGQTPNFTQRIVFNALR
jgi:hypothetical protein